MEAANIKQVVQSNKTKELSADEIIRTVKEFQKRPSWPSLPQEIGTTSLDTYNKVLAMEERPRVKLCYKEDTVFIVEFPSKWHQGAAGEIKGQIHDAVGRSLISRGTSTVHSPGNTDMEPDGAWSRRDGGGGGRGRGGRPSSLVSPQSVVLVLEVGYGQTMSSLRNKANRWLTETSAREIILVHISEMLRSLKAEIWRRDAANNPVQEEDFSHVAGAGVQFLNISLLNLFNNNPLDIPHELQGRFPNDQIQIDLYHPALYCFFVIVLLIVYILGYLINQGLTAFLAFNCSHGLNLSKSSNIDGIKSCINLLPFVGLLLLPAFYGINAVVLLFDSLYFFVPHIWITFVLIFFEGLFGGAAYVNTFYKIHQKVHPSIKEFRLGAASMADMYGIVSFGVFPSQFTT